MNPELKEFFAESLDGMSKHWTTEQKADELGMWALERGFGELPALDIGDDAGGVPQEEYDRKVEEAFSFLRGEALTFLRNI